MAVSKVILNGNTLMDATTATATAEDIVSPKTAIIASGEMAVGAIETSGGGDANPTVPENDIIFIDYDGTVRYSYTADEFLALVEMPANPSHDGLVAQGWNISLADAKTWVQDMGMLVIGQLYVTESGDTEIDLCLTEPLKSGNLGLGINGTIQIDWGDGTAVETVTGTSLTTIVNTLHTWPTSGDYTVKVKIVSGSIRLLKYNTNDCALFHGADTASVKNYAYRNSILAVRFGSGTIQLGGAAFGQCRSLRYITMPTQIRKATSWNADYYLFANCGALTGIVLPSAMSVGDNYNFQYCYSLRYASYFISNNCNYIHDNNYSLRRVNAGRGNTSVPYASLNACRALVHIFLPSSLTTVAGQCFKDCYALQSVTIPAAVATIEGSAFQNCYSLNEIHLLPITPPTLVNTNAFTNVPSTAVFYVPYSEDHSVLDAYQTATNWSTWADKMEEEP